MGIRTSPVTFLRPPDRLAWVGEGSEGAASGIGEGSCNGALREVEGCERRKSLWVPRGKGGEVWRRETGPLADGESEEETFRVEDPAKPWDNEEAQEAVGS